MCDSKCYSIHEGLAENFKNKLNDEETEFYLLLVHTVVQGNFIEFQRIATDCDDFRKWINKYIFINGGYERKIKKREPSLSSIILPSVDSSRSTSTHRIPIDAQTERTKYKAMNLCHIAAINHSIEIMRFLIFNGGDLSIQILEVEETRKNRKFIYTDSVLSLIILHFHDPLIYLKKMFNESITCEETNNDFEFTMDFSLLCPPTNENWTKDYVNKKPIKQMVVLNSILNSSNDLHCEQYELLTHPLVESFLACKWKHYRFFFFLLVILHLCFVISISSSAITVVRNVQLFHNETIGDLTLANYSELKNEGEKNRVIELSQKFYSTLTLINIFNSLSVIFGIFLFIHAIIQASFIRLKKLIWELEIVLNLFTAPCTIFICIYMIQMPVEGYFHSDYRWIYHVCSFIILPVWINLMLIVGRFPKLGCYSLMFTTVLQNFLKVMISFIFLIIGFALSFSLVFPKSESFGSPGQATLRTIVMMVGEFDFMDTFYDEENYFVIGTSRFIFLLFIISCSIILMNLTQGIAVNDIKLLHEISQIIRLEKETRFLYELECVFSHPIMTSQPFFRKIKRRLYDHGTKIEPLIVKRNNKQGLSNAVYDQLMKEFRAMK